MVDDFKTMLANDQLGYLVTVVEDSGCGIDDTNFERLFSMFN